MRNGGRDDDYTEFVAARLQALRRIAYLLCHDWHHADDLVQLTITRLYVHWHRVSVMDNPEAYTRTVLVRQFLRERGSGWARKVSLPGEMPDWLSAGPDHDDAIDVNAALADLPARQRATLVLRFYCDQTVDQVAEVLGCSAGTVKSQTSKGLASMRLALGAGRPDRSFLREASEVCADAGEVGDHG